MFRKFVELCESLDLIGGELVGVDGTKLKTVNSKSRNFNKKKLEYRIKRLDLHIAEYLNSDSEETRKARQTLGSVDAVLDTLARIPRFDFEVLSALLLRYSGAEQSYALGTVDEGGIDVFGRLQIGSAATISKGLLTTNLFAGRKGILFLGQCKHQKSEVGRPEIQKFLEATRECCEQYNGNTKPPPNHVPFTFYGAIEACIPIFITTAVFSSPARSLSSSKGLILVSGREISAFICYRKFGFEFKNQNYSFSERCFLDWLESNIHSVEFRE